MSPRTELGRLLTMLLSIVGIPLVFMILNEFGDIFSRQMIHWWERSKGLFARFFTSCHDSLHSKEEKRYSHQLPIMIPVSLTLFWMFLCSAVFLSWEQDWTLFTAFYFIFISLTTVGLGDTVPKVSSLKLITHRLLLQLKQPVGY